MNKSAIKGFSVRARRKLIEDISQKAYALGIKGTGKYDDIEEFEGGFRVKNAVNQIIYPLSTKKDREKLIAEINRKGFEQVVEEVAYTWFNRIVAIRFMEINEYLPVKIRMLSSEVEGKTEPDVITHIYDYVSELELDSEKVFNLKENHKDEELFKYVFVKECNNLGKLMPQVFKAIGDYTELLLPDQLLSSGSVVRDLVESIDEEDFKEEVEIIGWMYQYYISEKKDEVFAALKNNKKITKENIPAATQLFTPKWIVKYMTENSLGRLWQESHPDESLKQKWEYYIEPAEQEPEVQKKLDELRNPNLSPEEIKILDPAMGSGHILVYAFDVLYDIYLSRGYAERDIPQLILEKNLYGVDIDDRAAQLASFALLMKARSKNRRFFKNSVELNVCSIKESNGFSKEALDYIANPKEAQIEKVALLTDASYMIDVFKDAKEFGSILKVKKCNFDILNERVNEIINANTLNIFEYGYQNEIKEYIPDLVNQAKILSMKFDIVITNPPYMGRKGMNPTVIKYIDKYYSDSKNDLFAVFLEKCLEMTNKNGKHGVINQHSWMFLTGFETLREKLINNCKIESMIHLGSGAFEEIAGEVVQSTTCVLSVGSNDNHIGKYLNVSNIKDHQKKEISSRQMILGRDTENLYEASMNDFNGIPGKVIGYWLSHGIMELFSKGHPVSEFADSKKGLDTSSNDRFYRYWHEVSRIDVDFNVTRSSDDSIYQMGKWIPLNKGGSFRRWYGNFEYVINWENNGAELKAFEKSTIRNEGYYFRHGITWSDVATGLFSARFVESGFIFDSTGPTLFTSDNDMWYILGYFNCSVFQKLVDVTCPGLHYSNGSIAKIPMTDLNCDSKNEISSLVKNCVDIARDNWASYETNWGFSMNPLLKQSNSCSIKQLVNEYQISQLKNKDLIINNEKEINKHFVEKHNLKSDMTFDILKDPEYLIDSEYALVINLLSYFCGCLFGRYSIDTEGLVYAGGHFDQSKYTSFTPKYDNIILITEYDYFENDILHKFVEFLKVNFSKEAIDENLKYIAEVLNPKSKDTPRQTIRSYFVKDFYNDHVKLYKKRPIYWMIDSGKQNGIKALFYMHRYDKSTIARFRTDYLHEIQRYYENDIELTERSNDKKKLDNLKKKLQEVTEFDKVVAHIAHQQIEFDLDDGVDHNYELFQGVEVPQGDGQKPMKADLLAKRK